MHRVRRADRPREPFGAGHIARLDGGADLKRRGRGVELRCGGRGGSEHRLHDGIDLLRAVLPLEGFDDIRGAEPRELFGECGDGAHLGRHQLSVNRVKNRFVAEIFHGELRGMLRRRRRWRRGGRRPRRRGGRRLGRRQLHPLGRGLGRRLAQAHCAERGVNGGAAEALAKAIEEILFVAREIVEHVLHVTRGGVGFADRVHCAEALPRVVEIALHSHHLSLAVLALQHFDHLILAPRKPNDHVFDFLELLRRELAVHLAQQRDGVGLDLRRGEHG